MLPYISTNFINAQSGWSVMARVESRVKICGRLKTMHRFHTVTAAFLVIALLATPLALLARAPGDPTQCCGAYCPMRAHSGQQKTMCGSLSMTDHNCGCTMRSNQQPDYGLNALMAPTAPSACVRLTAPESSRAMSSRYTEFAMSGTSTTPFHPPRS
jgi:hypothetical protein